MNISRMLTTWWLNRKASVAVLFDRKAAAIDDLRRILALQPRDEVTRAALGNLLAETGDTTGAMAEFQTLVQNNPKNAEAWFNLGFLHDQLDDLKPAEDAFRRAIALRPSIDRAWYGLGLILVREARLEESLDAFRRNIKLQPFSPYGYYQLGMTLHHLGRPQEARKVVEDLKKFEPKYAATLARDLERTVPLASRGPPATDSPPKEPTALPTH
jgi:tetratricopeptide (TPR) repeat protein